MPFWRQLVHHPQQLWVRRALFQVHLWIGVALSLYVIVVSVSGSAIVFRRELTKRYPRKAIVVSALGGPRLSASEQERNAVRSYPSYEVFIVRQPEQPDQPDLIVLGRGRRRIERFFDPYTGADLGDPLPALDRWLRWLTDLHDNLLSGMIGRTINGAGALLMTLLGITGLIIWWPGLKSWRRSLKIKTSTRFARLTWDLHSATGFWCSVFVLIWGISGVCLCFPGVLDTFVGGEFRYWVTDLHFGRFNPLTEVLWTLLGLAPCILAVTGALMWWNRTLVKKFRRRRTAQKFSSVPATP